MTKVAVGYSLYIFMMPVVDAEQQSMALAGVVVVGEVDAGAEGKSEACYLIF